MSLRLTCSPLEHVKTVVGEKLKGEVDFHRWAGRMKRAIESVDKYYLEVLNREYEPPFNWRVEDCSVEEAKARIVAFEISQDRPCTLADVTNTAANNFIRDNVTKPNVEYDKWDKACIMLACFITATIDNRVESQVTNIRRGPDMWDMLAKHYGHATRFTYVQVYNNWTSIEYKQGGGYSVFLSKWCQAYDEVLTMGPVGQVIPQFIVYTTFINAVSKNPDCAHWVKSDNWSIDKLDVIRKVIPEFVANEQWAYSMRGNTSSSAAAISQEKNSKKKDKKPHRKPQAGKPKYYCRFHKKQVTHKEEDCYFNPATPAQSASAASTTSSTEPAEFSAKMAHIELTGSSITNLFDDGADDHINWSAASLPTPPSVPTPTTSMETDTTSLG
ncbi:hypothetical protein N7486_002382 [Penicillium sp. IBT 16267x]|nr:hypothetical protein N7486_002382 [Penicillium sp. IBT 16267x]